MALNLPAVTRASKLANTPLKKPTAGSKTGLGISGVKIPKTVNVNALFSKPATVKKSAAPVSPYDQFTQNDPYDPSQISNLAASGYQSDVANAQKLAAMGQPTSASITTDFAQRGQAANQVYADLAARIGGIQQATVAQGNAGAAGLTAANAAAQQGAPNIAGAPAAPGIPTAGVQAVLGAQTAAGGNYQGTLQAAALSSGAQANQRALDAGTVASTDATNNTAKTLASLLSGLPTQSAREATMTGANQQVDASNLQTKLSIYQGNVQQAAALRSIGATAAANKLDAQNKIDLENIRQAGSTGRTALQQEGQTTRTGITTSATNKRAADKRAADKAAAALKAKNALTLKKTPGTSTATTPGGKPATRYRVTVNIPKTTKGPKDLLGKQKDITTFSPSKQTVPAAVWQKFLASGPPGKRKLSILGVPEGSKVKYESATGY